MSGTRLRPFRRTAWNPTADEALRLYADLREGPACGHALFRADDPPCAACADWWAGHDQLYARLDLPPHHWPAFVLDSTGSHAQAALKDALEAALREARDAVNGSPVPPFSSEERAP